MTCFGREAILGDWDRVWVEPARSAGPEMTSAARTTDTGSEVKKAFIGFTAAILDFIQSL